MSVRQYVGARYVPKFFENSATGDSTWASNTAYEPLTIVTWNGNSYTSKKAVPSGIGNPSSNADYWASTGMFNAQVETLREEMEEVIADVASHENRLDTVEADVELNTARLDRNVIFIGDSYFQMESNYIPTALSQAFTRTGGSVINKYLGGAGFVGNSQGKTFADLFSDAMQDVTDADSITDVVLMGGCNDVDYTYQQVNTAKDSLVATITTQCPKAKIHIMCIGGFIDPNRRKLLYDVSYYIYTAVSTSVCIYPDAILPMLALTNYAEDGIHPNAAGVRSIVAYVVNKLIGNSGTYGAFITDYNTTISGMVLNLKPGDGCWAIGANQSTVSTTGTIDYAYNTGFSIDLGVVTKGLVPSSLYSAPKNKLSRMSSIIPINIAVLESGGTSWKILNGELTFAYDTTTGSTHCMIVGTTAPSSGSGSSARILPFFTNVTA